MTNIYFGRCARVQYVIQLALCSDLLQRSRDGRVSSSYVQRVRAIIIMIDDVDGINLFRYIFTL